jgi:hypothetical protein
MRFFIRGKPDFHCRFQILSLKFSDHVFLSCILSFYSPHSAAFKKFLPSCKIKQR